MEFRALVADAAELGVALELRQAETLLAFGDLLLHWNRAFNLVSRRDTARLVPRHLLDSLTAAPWLTGIAVLDLGTGAGLPGVPLAIAREDAQFTLIDRSERKIRFLGQVVRTLGLANVSLRCSDVTQLPAGEDFDTVVCRALADPGSAWALAADRVRPEGRMVVMTRAGIAPEAPELAPPELPANAQLEARHRVHIPGLEQPHELVLLRHVPDKSVMPG
jgi:16S rRNA (guanine527-N7)-methyltransferase